MNEANSTNLTQAILHECIQLTRESIMYIGYTRLYTSYFPAHYEGSNNIIANTPSDLQTECHTSCALYRIHEQLQYLHYNDCIVGEFC